MKLLVHLCQRPAWEQAQARGEYRAPSLDSEGFIHCSRPEQVQRVALRFYQAMPELVLLWIDAERVLPEIRWEAADGETFPHIYGPLNLEAVVSVQDYDPTSAILVSPD
jgi:uncharacterized protein (DUF952 family)